MTWFWFDDWCQLGRLWSLIGSRGVIDLGIGKDTKLVDIPVGRRQRRHRIPLLNQVEEELESAINLRNHGSDRHLWRANSGQFKTVFSSKETWMQIREHHEEVAWSKGIWFSQSLPKYSFMAWLAVRNRLSTGDRMRAWGSAVNTDCVLCSGQLETIHHIFFDCPYSLEVWVPLAEGLMGQSFTSSWDSLLIRVSDCSGSRGKRFLLRFVFQTVIHLLWMERNRRRHGEGLIPAIRLVAAADAIVKSRALSLKGVKHYEDVLLVWYKCRLG